MSKTCAIFLAGLFSLGVGRSAELLNPVRLPDDGFGSNAHAATADHPLADDLAYVFGSKNKGTGDVVPVYWFVEEDNGGPNGVMGEFAIPVGAQGEAVGGAVFPNGDVVAVGNLLIGNIERAVLWRRPLMGEWGSPQPLAPNAEGSSAARADYCGEGGGQLSIAGSVRNGGRNQAVVFSFKGELVGIEPLMTPPGMSSSGREILVDCTSFGNFVSRAVAGSITDRRGNTRPAVWLETANGWATFPNLVPSGTEGDASGSIIILDNDGETEVARFDVAGTLLRSGRTIGFAARGGFGNIESDYLLLPPLPGFENSSVVSHYDMGDTGTHEVGHWMGVSSNPGGGSVATLWFCDYVGYIRPRSVPARQLLVNPLAVSQMLRIEEAGVPNLFVGQCVDEGNSAFASAYLFTPAGYILPEKEDEVLVGVRHREPAGATQLWHDDENALRVQPVMSGKQRRAVVEVRFQAEPPVGNCAEIRRCIYPMCGGVYLTANASNSASDATGTLNVYAYDGAAAEYRLKGSFALTEAEQTINAFAWDCLDHDQIVNPVTGEIRIRLEFVQNGNDKGELVLDMMQVRKPSEE